MANPLISRPVNTSKGFSSVTASSLVVQDDFPINKAIHTQEIITNDINFNSALSDGQITFTTTTTNNADVTADKGAFIHGTYDNTVQTGKSVSLLYFNAKNHGAATSQLYPIQMDLDTDNTDTGAGIAFNNNGKSDCIYMNVNGKSAGSASPSGIGMDLNRGDYNNSQFGLQIWDFSNTDRGIFGPSGIYLRKHGTATNSSHRLLRMYGRKYLQTFELDNISGSEKFMSAFYEPTGQNVLNFYTDGKIEAFGGVVDSTLTASKPVFTDANKKLSSSGTVPIANGGTNSTSFGTSGGVTYYNGTSIVNDADLTFDGEKLSTKKLRFGDSTNYVDFSVEDYAGTGTPIMTMHPHWGFSAGEPISLIRGGMFLQTYGGVTAQLLFLKEDASGAATLSYDEANDRMNLDLPFQAGSYFSSDGSNGISATITTAKLTALGANGSMTFKDGLLTAQTQAT